MYYPGAIGFTTVNGEPKVGELLDKTWSITEKCRFKILDKKPSKPTRPATKDTQGDAPATGGHGESEIKMETGTETDVAGEASVESESNKQQQLTTEENLTVGKEKPLEKQQLPVIGKSMFLSAFTYFNFSNVLEI